MKKLFSFVIMAGLVLMTACSLAEEPEKAFHADVGSIVTFGCYEQDGNPDNGPERIEWIVLDVREDKCLLLSRYCLDTKPYHTRNKNITWKDSALRKWLNGDFLKDAFVDTEQELISVTAVDNGKKQGYQKWKKTKGGKDTKDRIFLLSCAEASRYLGVAFGGGALNTAAQAEPTAYAVQKGAYCERVHDSESPDTAYAWWWLRSPGYVQTAAAGVGGHGTFLDSGSTWEEACVRPALWVKVNELTRIFLTEQPLTEKRTCGDYTYTVLENGTAEIIRYSGKNETVAIPDVLDTYPVTAIGDAAFEYCLALAAVTVPDGVTALCDSAFAYCRNLASVSLPDSLETIGSGAFMGCAGLASVTIPDTVKVLGNDAFFGCSGLTSVTLPDSVEEIGDSAFADCSGLTSITIPGSVKHLGEFTFYCCRGLTSVTIRDGLTEIPSYTFSDCEALRSIAIPDSVKTIGIRAFWSCSALTSVEIPEGVAAIGPEAFGDCAGLASVAFPDSVTSVGDSPFTSCSSLQEIRISPGHPYLSLLDGVLFSRPDHRLICYTTAFSAETYTVPDGVRVIGDRAFWDCSPVKAVILPDSMTDIGEEAFAYCTSLHSVRIPENVTVIGDHAFYGDPKELTVTAVRGSFAEQYCKKNRLKHRN